MIKDPVCGMEVEKEKIVFEFESKKMMEGGMMQGTKEKSAESERTDTTSEHKTHH